MRLGSTYHMSNILQISSTANQQAKRSPLLPTPEGGSSFFWSWDSSPPPTTRTMGLEVSNVHPIQKFPLNSLPSPFFPSLYLSQQVSNQLLTTNCPQCPSLGHSFRTCTPDYFPCGEHFPSPRWSLQHLGTQRCSNLHTSLPSWL